jgi:pSer/pThr/pTyr-binding forkhead associated (FHA) protein
MVTEEDLVRGVVIGRSEKCHTEMLRRITDVGTSRVHILVMREGPVVYAYDLASTQGTFAHGVPVRRVVLHDAGSSITLGCGEHAVRMLWQLQA